MTRLETLKECYAILMRNDKRKAVTIIADRIKDEILKEQEIEKQIHKAK